MTSVAGARTSGRKSSPIAIAVLLGVAFLLVAQAIRLVTGNSPLDGTLDDADSYMRLVRVLQCHGRCPGGLVMRSNAPFGEVLHWPFLEDWLLLGIAAPFRLFLPFRPAVTVAGYLWGPLLSVFLVWGLVRIADRVAPAGFLWLVGLFLTTQVWILTGFRPLAVDHHGFIVTLFVLTMAAALPALRGEADLGMSAVWTGLALGVGLWESIEVLVAAVPLIGALGLQWIAGGRSEMSRFHRTMFATAALVLGFALLVDGPHPHRLAAEYDRFSIVHVLLISLAALFWVVVARLPARTRLSRSTMAVLGMAAVVGITLTVFPAFARGPHALTPPELFPLWISPTTEYIPAIHHEAVWRVLSLGPLLLVLPVAALRATRGAVPDRMLWAFLLATCLWFGGFAAFEQIRWTYYIHALYPVAAVALLAQLAHAAGRFRVPLVIALAQVSAVLLLLAAPIVAMVLLRNPATPGAPGCSPRETSDVVQSAGATDSVPVLAQVFAGPEILYRTDHSVIATPYHRNFAATRASLGIMAATDFDEARRIVADRGIGLLAVCPAETWYPRVPPDSDGTLYAALQAGSPPDWLRRLPPRSPDQRIVIWQVTGD